jgi:predicted DCC family thiol-disulfide oxidoreductase YuxK
VTDIASDDERPVVIFDGYCKFCNFWVNFLLAADTGHKLVFAARQSAAGAQLLSRFSQHAQDLDTVVLVENSVFAVRSTAILHAFRLMGGLWQMIYFLIVVPRPFRDFIYDSIARNRFRWFGKRAHCRMPSLRDRDYFLE